MKFKKLTNKQIIEKSAKTLERATPLPEEVWMENLDKVRNSLNSCVIALKELQLVEYAKPLGEVSRSLEFDVKQPLRQLIEKKRAPKKILR